MEIINQLFSAFLLSIYSVVGNLGLTIIVFTILVRTLLLPLTMPALKAQKKMQSIQPELSKLRKKHGKDAKALQMAQMELYKKYNLNPLAGCIPQLVQIGILILLYHVLTVFLHQDVVNGVTINPDFLWLNLSIPDPLFIIPVVAAVTQLILSLMLAPATEVRDVVPNNAKSAKLKAANENEKDMADMAQTMQQQMIFIMPVMTGIFALSFPSGLGLYWIATTVVSIVQQYFISGPGGIVSYAQRARMTVSRLLNSTK